MKSRGRADKSCGVYGLRNTRLSNKGPGRGKRVTEKWRKECGL